MDEKTKKIRGKAHMLKKRRNFPRLPYGRLSRRKKMLVVSQLYIGTVSKLEPAQDFP
jgi:hypothetical protein